LPLGLVSVILATFAFVFVLHNISLRASDRWVNPLMNNILKNVMPYPERLDYFSRLGMPVTEEMLALINSHGNEMGFYEIEPLMEWVAESGFSAYQTFLLSHPGWAFQKLYQNLDEIFVSNRQPYFRGTPQSTPLWMLPIGDKLHPRTPAVFLVDFVLMLVLVLMIVQRKRVSRLPWAILLAWLFACELALLFVTFHGDALGITRHALIAVVPARMSMWLSGALLLDVLLEGRFSRAKISHQF
jgi:hypothetical protein